MSDTMLLQFVLYYVTLPFLQNILENTSAKIKLIEERHEIKYFSDLFSLKITTEKCMKLM